jgi:hypothetical protein
MRVVTDRAVGFARLRAGKVFGAPHNVGCLGPNLGCDLGPHLPFDLGERRA